MTRARITRRDPLRAIVLVLLFGAAFVGAPFANHYWLEILTDIGILIIFVVGIDFLVGYTGLITLGHAGFMGVGAYSLVWIAHIQGIPVSAAMPLAILAGAVAAVVVGMRVPRVSGVFFIMVTLAISMLFYSWAFKARQPFGGDDGLSVAGTIRLDLSSIGINLDDQFTFCLFVLALALAAYLLFEWLVRTPFGQTLGAIRQNENRVRALGCPVGLYKVAAFTVAGALAALAGALDVQKTEFLHPDVSFWIKSGEGLIIVIVGGMGTLVGPVIGTFLFVLFHKGVEALTPHWQLWMGLTFIAIVIVAPDGIYGRLRSLVEAVGRKRAGSTDPAAASAADRADTPAEGEGDVRADA